MQEFRYVNEYNLSDMNIHEQIVTATPNNIWLVVTSVLISLLLGVGIFLIVTNNSIFKSRTVYEIAIAFIVMGIVMIAVQAYNITQNIHYIGHYEVEGQVVGFANNNAEDDNKILVKLKHVKEPIEAEIPDKQDLKRKDKVLVKTETMNFKERPTKELSNFELALNGVDIGAFKR